MPDTVAAEGRRVVGGVVVDWETPGRRVGLDLIAPDREQRAERPAVVRAHAAQRVGTDAPRQVHQHGLDLVVGLVPRSHSDRAQVHSRAAQEGLSPAAGRHLQRLALVRGGPGGAPAGKGDAPGAAGDFDVRGYSGAVLAPGVIEMQYVQGRPAALAGRQQGVQQNQ